MNEIKITIINDGKKKRQSFEATADFDYICLDWNVNGGDFSITAYGSTEIEAKTRLIEELHRFQKILVEEVSKI